jgi:hypothetical protein
MTNTGKGAWATCDVNWGEGRKHIYCTDRESFEFHKTHAEALDEARKTIESGTKMVAVLKVENLFEARAEMVLVELES